MYIRPKRQVLILGGGYAGLVAAARAARAGDRVEVTLVNGDAHFVQRIRMHELLAGRQPRTLPIAPLLHKRGVRFVEGYVDLLEPARQRVVGHYQGGGVFAHGYDELVVALGSRTGAQAPGVAEHTLQLNDRSAVQAASGHIRGIAGRGGRVLIVGGGLSAIETASELAEQWPGLSVSLVTSGRLGAAFASAGAEHLYAKFERLGIALHEGTAIVGVEAGQAVVAGGYSLPFDLCVWCGGFEASPLGRAAGLAVDDHGRIVVDAMLRSVAAANIFAVGDAAAATMADHTIRMGCVSALPMGAHTGDNIRRLVRGEQLQPFAMDFMLRCISLGRRDGLIQWTEADDSPRDTVWTRRRAAVTKEAICRMTYATVACELQLGLSLYRWPGSGRASEDRATLAQELSA